MENAILVESCIMGILLLSIFCVMIWKDGKLGNRAWWLGVLIISVLLYVIAISLTTIINTRFGY